AVPDRSDVDASWPPRARGDGCLVSAAIPIGAKRMKTKRKKATAVAMAAGVAGVLVVLFGAVYAVNTFFDHEKSERFTISQPVQKVVVASDGGDVEVVATATKRVIVRQTTHWVTSKPTPERTVSGGVLRLAAG